MYLKIFSRRSLFLGGLVLYFLVAQEVTAFEHQALFVTQDPAPGLDPGYTVVDLYPSMISPAGQVFILGNVVGPGINPPEQRALWVHTDNVTRLAQFAGDPVPGLPSVSFSPPSLPAEADLIGNYATLGFVYDDNNPNKPYLGVLYDDGSGPGLIAASGWDVPGTTNATYKFLSNVHLLDNGDAIFTSEIEGPDVQNGINNDLLVRYSGGQVTQLLRSGSDAPGLSNAQFNGLENIRGNARGHVAIYATVKGDGIVRNVNDRGIWTTRSGELALDYISGDDAPGIPGAVFSYLTTPRMNHSGDLLMQAAVSGTDIHSENDQGLWLEVDGDLQLIARRGDIAPGALSNQRKFHYFYNVLLNDNGQALFTAGWTSGGYTDGSPNTKTGIWKYANGSLELIARDDTDAPGFGSIDFVLDRYNVKFNASGQVAFLSRLETSAIEYGIWATDLNGTLKLIVRRGMTIDIDDSPDTVDERTVLDVDLFDGEAFNDMGELVYWARFTDGSEGVIKVKTYEGQYGDADGDGDVDADDMFMIQSQFGLKVEPGTGGDVNRNGFVDAHDLRFALRNWTSDTLPEGSIPEPGSLAMLGSLFLLLNKRGKR